MQNLWYFSKILWDIKNSYILRCTNTYCILNRLLFQNNLKYIFLHRQWVSPKLFVFNVSQVLQTSRLTATFSIGQWKRTCNVSPCRQPSHKSRSSLQREKICIAMQGFYPSSIWHILHLFFHFLLFMFGFAFWPIMDDRVVR